MFFDRKDELEYMQKVCWSIIEKNQSNADIQIKTIEQLHIISDKLTNLYHSFTLHVEFGARRHFYIDKECGAILTPEQHHLDNSIEAIYRVQYEKDFAEMKKKHPTMSDDEIDSLIEEQEQKEEEIQKTWTRLLEM